MFFLDIVTYLSLNFIGVKRSKNSCIINAESINNVPITTFIVSSSWLTKCPNISASGGDTSEISATLVAGRCVSK